MIRTNLRIKFCKEAFRSQCITYIMNIFILKILIPRNVIECIPSKLHTSVSNILGPEGLQLNGNSSGFIALVFLTHKRRTEQPFANNGSYLNRVPSSVQ